MDSYIELAKQLDSQIFSKILDIRILELSAENKRLDMELQRMEQPQPLIDLPQTPDDIPTQTLVNPPQTHDHGPFTEEQLAKEARMWIADNIPITGTEVEVYYGMYEGAHKYPLSSKDFEWTVRRLLGNAPKCTMAIIEGRQVLIRKW